MLDAALARASDGQAGAVLLGGDAGMGKSRLVAEFERRATEGGALVLVGECVDLAGGELAYGPVVAALRPLVGNPDGPAAALPLSARATLSRLWPALAGNGTVPVEPAEFGQGQLFEALHDLIAEAAAEQPVALVIEDLQWADRSTRDLLTFLIRNSRGQRVLFVASYRSDELHRGHPLHPFVTELERAGGAERLDLPPFDPAEVAAQLAGILGEEPEPWLAARLAERSGGNPFFAEELLAAADEGPMPESLRDALLMRVERLSPAARDVLTLSAAAGRSVGHPLLAAATSLEPSQLAAALREAVAHRVLVTAPRGDEYEFRHALMREAVYADLLPGERVPLHAKLANAIEAEPALATTGSAVAELAYHWHAAGDAERGLPASLESGAEAERRHAHAEAQLQFERALELWQRVPADRRPDTTEAEIARRAALAASVSNGLRRAVVLERRVLELTTDAVEQAMSHARLGRYLFLVGAGDEALTQYEAAVDLVPPEPPSPERARVLAAYSHALMISGRLKEANRLGTEALDMARRAGEPLVEVSVLNTLGPTRSAVADPDDGLEAMRRARAMAEELGAVEEIGRSYINESHVLEEIGRLRESVEVALSGIKRSRELGTTRGWGAFLNGDLAARMFKLGEWDEAVAITRDVLDHVPSELNAASAWTVRGRIAAERGDFDEAAEALGRSERLSARAGPQWSGPNYFAFVTLELWRGDVAAALDAATRGIDEIGRFEMVINASELYALHARASVDSALRDRLLGRDEDGKSTEAAARAGVEHLRAALHRAERTPSAALDHDLGLAELSRLDDDRRPDLWLSLAERWSACDQPYRAAYTQWRAAEALIAAGERGSQVEQLIAAVAATAERLGAAPMGAEIASLARRAQLGGGIGTAAPADNERNFGLTPREHEVLVLVAAGKTNREIGAELFMSEKTASVHVSRILQKLGVANRAEAAGVAHTLGLRA